MSQRGLELTRAALRSQLTAVVWPRYEVRLIDAVGRTCRGTRYWTAAQLLGRETVRFLRARNREGCEVYFRPHAGANNAGYLLLDFDQGPCPREQMRAAGQLPCVVVQTSPGHQQAWVRVSRESVPPSWATAVARGLARRYGADPASAEWRHLGRLAGFTNRKASRWQPNGLPPWVRVVWQCVGAWATVADNLGVGAVPGIPEASSGDAPIALPTTGVYRECLETLRLLEQFPQPDWSIVDYRVARFLLQRQIGAAGVAAVLRQGSPGFPRNHPRPEDYLQRTVAAAAASLARGSTFSRATWPARRG